MEKTRRTAIAIPEGLLVRIDRMKKKRFFNVSYSEMYRQLIRAGLESLEGNTAKKSAIDKDDEILKDFHFDLQEIKNIREKQDIGVTFMGELTGIPDYEEIEAGRRQATAKEKQTINEILGIS